MSGREHGDGGLTPRPPLPGTANDAVRRDEGEDGGVEALRTAVQRHDEAIRRLGVSATQEAGKERQRVRDNVVEMARMYVRLVDERRPGIGEVPLSRMVSLTQHPDAPLFFSERLLITALRQLPLDSQQAIVTLVTRLAADRAREGTAYGEGGEECGRPARTMEEEQGS